MLKSSKLLSYFVIVSIFYLTSTNISFAVSTGEFLQDIITKIKANYVREVDEKKLIDSALSGMLGSLDPHSAYLDAKTFNENKDIIQGEFSGIGAELIFEQNALRIISPYKDSPAFRVGIRPNDVIVAINGKNISEIEGGAHKAVEELKGAVGSVVLLKVLKRDGKIRDYKIVREMVKIPSVNVKLVSNKSIAYINIKSFNGNTAISVQKEFENLKKMANNKLDGIIFDLRWNGGGLLNQAVEVVDLFLNDSDIVSVRGNDKEEDISYHSNEGDISFGLPIVVIINSGTASAGEIVAGAFQDNKRALILGTKSFGKGSIQRIIPLSNGGALKLTSYMYYTPNGNEIQAMGIMPDIVVEEAIVYPVQSTSVISEASLKGHIIPESNQIRDDKAQNKIKQQEEVQNHLQMNQKEQKSASDIKEVIDLTLEKITGEEGKDFQLMRAIDTIKGMSLYKNSNTEKYTNENILQEKMLKY